MNRFISLLTVCVCVAFAACDTGIAPADESLEVAAKKAEPTLDCTIFCTFVGTMVDPTHLLAWEAEVHGDIEGTMIWIFDLAARKPNFPPTAHVGFYSARWEIYDEAGALILAGDSSGRTAKPKDKDGIWTGTGIVTETGPGYESWMGRNTYESGAVIFTTTPMTGPGVFRVN